MKTDQNEEGVAESRRKFLATCGRFAVITPPTVTLMLSSAAQNFAVAASGSSMSDSKYRRPTWNRANNQWHRTRRADNGLGDGKGDDGVHGLSQHADLRR